MPKLINGVVGPVIPAASQRVLPNPSVGSRPATGREGASRMLDQVPSVTKVNQVGDILREFATMTTASTARRFSLAQTLEAFEIVEIWRAAHAKPLQAATMGLRSRVTTAGYSDMSRVSQRLKRIPTILDKLRREPGMELAGWPTSAAAEQCWPISARSTASLTGTANAPHLRSCRCATTSPPQR